MRDFGPLLRNRVEMWHARFTAVPGMACGTEKWNQNTMLEKEMREANVRKYTGAQAPQAVVHTTHHAPWRNEGAASTRSSCFPIRVFLFSCIQSTVRENHQMSSIIEWHTQTNTGLAPRHVCKTHTSRLFLGLTPIRICPFFLSVSSWPFRLFFIYLVCHLPVCGASRSLGGSTLQQPRRLLFPGSYFSVLRGTVLLFYSIPFFRAIFLLAFC